MIITGTVITDHFKVTQLSAWLKISHPGARETALQARVENRPFYLTSMQVFSAYVLDTE